LYYIITPVMLPPHQLVYEEPPRIRGGFFGEGPLFSPRSCPPPGAPGFFLTPVSGDRLPGFGAPIFPGGRQKSAAFVRWMLARGFPLFRGKDFFPKGVVLRAEPCRGMTQPGVPGRKQPPGGIGECFGGTDFSIETSKCAARASR